VRIIKSFRLLVYFLSFFIFIIIISCSEKGTNPADEKFIIPDSNISFYEHIEPLFNARCGLESGCHSVEDTDNPLPYSVLINRNALVNNYQLSSTGELLIDLSVHKSNPQLAPLYLIVAEGYPETYTDRMPPPPYYDPLSDNQIEGIRRWIGEGAPP
jgi:hypothetical protein